MAVRETVINAIMHGNKNNPSKRIFIDFECVSNGRGRDLVVRVRDQGDGFNPEELADPLAPENILNLGGRGLFLVRQFMDAVDIHPALQGGTEVRMLKHI
jgi:serine/threonine-protein kinase RsbW